MAPGDDSDQQARTAPAGRARPGKVAGGTVDERLLQATFDLVGEQGLARVSVAAVARRAGVGRATIYRHVPGGRAELLRATVSWEAERFLHRLAGAVAGAPDLASVLARGLRFARRAIDEHHVLDELLRTEPEHLIPLFSSSSHWIRDAVAGFLVPFVGEPAAARDLDARWVADELARMVISFISSPGSWDLDDDGELDGLVHDVFLAFTRAGDEVDAARRGSDR